VNDIQETVRVGLAVRSKNINFRINSSYKINDSSGSVVSNLLPGEYKANVIEEGSRPLWSSRVISFKTSAMAQKFIGVFRKFGFNPELRQMGSEVEWLGRKLDARTWAVTLGGGYDPETNNAGVVAEITPLMTKLGFIKYPDQLFKVNSIRSAPPEGGVLEIVNDNGEAWKISSTVRLIPENPEDCFELPEVRLGIDFHWDHVESLSFKGILEITVDGDCLTVINEVTLADYLASLLGSEMRQDWHINALAAQAVAARSTVLATRGRHHFGEAFDLCHDDHCQCYQGVTRESEVSRNALDLTRNAILEYDGHVADTRYSKSCGGLSEDYNTAWDDWNIPYLKTIQCVYSDSKDEKVSLNIDWSENDSFERALVDQPIKAACNPALYPYPQSSKEMEKLFRWKMVIPGAELAELIELRTGRSLGYINSLEILERGKSGRIRYLRVIGENGSVTVGKELQIRRLLSHSHFPSSAFTIERQDDGVFMFEGLGWGHGVGMCQLGSAALAAKGWKWEKLLSHYYPGTELIKK